MLLAPLEKLLPLADEGEHQWGGILPYFALSSPIKKTPWSHRPGTDYVVGIGLGAKGRAGWGWGQSIRTLTLVHLCIRFPEFWGPLSPACPYHCRFSLKPVMHHCNHPFPRTTPPLAAGPVHPWLSCMHTHTRTHAHTHVGWDQSSHIFFYFCP